MRSRDIIRFVNGTSDPAYAVDGLGHFVAWNYAACAVFDIAESEVVGKRCFEVLCGSNEDGTVCSNECVVLRAVRERRRPSNFDMRINAADGRKWFNVSLTVVEVTSNMNPYVIHILRSTDVYKRLEFVIRDFVIGETSLPKDTVNSIVSSASYVGRGMTLTPRQLEILKLVAKGGTSATIGARLHISPTTVDNHMQNVLKKLNVHSRLEAVMHAEHAGLL